MLRSHHGPDEEGIETVKKNGDLAAPIVKDERILDLRKKGMVYKKMQ